MAESFLVHMPFELNAGGRLEMYSAASSGVVGAKIAEATGEATTHSSIDFSNLTRRQAYVVLLQFHSDED